MAFLFMLFYALLFFSIHVSSQLQNELFFPGFKNVDTTIDLTGVAEFHKNGILRLTNETSRLMGHAFYTSPFKFKSSTDGKVFSFSTSFALAIVPEYPKLGGHGLAFTISASKHLQALPSQYLGLLNATDVGNFTNHLLAVEFDTVRDFEFGDIDDNHVGIDINSLKSNASAPAAYYTNDSSTSNSSKQDLNLKSGKPILVWIDYDSIQNVLNVTISPVNKKPKSPILSFPIDLSPVFQEQMYVGFSASTGLLASSHYILGWSFKLNGESKDLDLSSLPSIPSNSKKKHPNSTIGVIISSVCLAVLVLSFAIFYLIRKIRNAETIEAWELEMGPHRFSYKELKQATKGFSDKEILGQGGFGQVFKGTLSTPDSKIEIAVKRISNDSNQGLREFVSEISSVGKLRHRNLVQLLGWCRKKDDFLLVYDYMCNGSLDRFLFDEPKHVLNWEQRFKIIKDVASGLLYLHEGYEQVVIHRDVKASNVLLDSELTGRLGDFGLARLYEHGSNPGTTRVVGTLGYLAPELPRTGKATTSSDVYAYGALLLEVACGRRPVEGKALPEEMVLVDWVWDMYREGKWVDVVDKKLNGDYNEKEMKMVIKLGIMCSNDVAVARPLIRQVMRYLDGEIRVPDNVLPPHGGIGSRSSGIEGFDEFVNSSSFDDMNSYSCYSFTENGGTNLLSFSSSPPQAQTR
ncbi:L-type lectin-domain containing receptor kinase S.4-like [Euphorbia lathyris]|uniref:L-type lectin-domain containing receptor kinase S.4-like n=1 Tax=Euphorbia lathyris TaxID=212925 RepID=UPI00331356C7